MADFNIKANDTLPKLRATLTYSDSSTVDLTGSTVQFVMRSENSVIPTVKSPATIITPTAPAVVEYEWVPVDTAAPDSYLGEFEVTFADLKVRTFPTEGYFTIDIVADLDAEG